MTEPLPAPVFPRLLERVALLPAPDADRLVSVVVPFLDGDRFFDEMIDGVLSQTWPDWELLLVDDGSTDASREKAIALAAANPARVRRFEHEGHANLGQAASRNVAFAHARGRYIAMLDADDLWLPPKLAYQVDLLERHPDASMVYGPLVYWYGWTGRREDQLRDFVSPHGRRHDQLIPAPDQLLHLVVFKDGIPAPSSALVRRTVIDAGIRFDERFGMYDDEVFFAQVALRWPVYLSSRAYELYRQHPDSFCAQAVRAGEYDVHRPNPARGEFLRWLRDHVAGSGLATAELTEAIGEALAAYEADGS